MQAIIYLNSDLKPAEIAAQAILKRRRVAEHSAIKKRKQDLPSSLDPAAAVRNFSPSLSRFHPERALSFQPPRAPCRDMTNAPAAWWQNPDSPSLDDLTAIVDASCTGDAPVASGTEASTHELKDAQLPANPLNTPGNPGACHESKTMASSGSLILLNEGEK